MSNYPRLGTGNAYECGRGIAHIIKHKWINTPFQYIDVLDQVETWKTVTIPMFPAAIVSVGSSTTQRGPISNTNTVQYNMSIALYAQSAYPQSYGSRTKAVSVDQWVEDLKLLLVQNKNLYGHMYEMKMYTWNVRPIAAFDDVQIITAREITVVYTGLRLDYGVSTYQDSLVYPEPTELLM